MNDFNFVGGNFYSDLRITVAGIGKAGINAVGFMIKNSLQGIEFVIASNDETFLDTSSVQSKIHLTDHIEKIKNDIKSSIEGTDLLFLIADLSEITIDLLSIFAEKGNDINAMIIPVLFLPVSVTGAMEEIKKVKQHSAFIILIYKTENSNEIMYLSVKAITDILKVRSFINVDIGDLRTVIPDNSICSIGIGIANGENMVSNAAHTAIQHSKINNSTKAVIINIAMHPDKLNQNELMDVISLIQSNISDEANYLMGTSYDETLDKNIRVTLIATGD